MWTVLFSLCIRALFCCYDMRSLAIHHASLDVGQHHRGLYRITGEKNCIGDFICKLHFFRSLQAAP